MKKLFYIIIILLCIPVMASAATYTVCAADEPTCDYGDIGEVNAASFSNDDVIEFERGETFDDEPLTLNGTAVGVSGLIIQAGGTGDKPRIDGNAIQPILINHALVNLTIKDLDCSGMDWSGTDYNVRVQYVNGLTLDGLYIDGHVGASSYTRHNGAIGPGAIEGNLEIKNCTVTNFYKAPMPATIADRLDHPWGTNDSCGIELWYLDGGLPKLSGTVSIHDNTITNMYADGIQIGGYQVSDFKIYNNTISGFGENAIDIKATSNLDVYNNDMSQDAFGVAGGAGTQGPATISLGSSYSSWPGYRSRDNKIHDNYFHDTIYTTIATGMGLDGDIYNNYFEDAGCGVFIAFDGMKVYNNLFNLTATVSTELSTIYRSAIRNSGEFDADYNFIYNNTFYISGSNYLYGIAWQGKVGQGGNEIKNNIIQMTSASAVYPIYATNATKDIIDVDYNTYYNANDTARVSWNATAYTTANFSTWQALGDPDEHANDLSGNPEFTTPGTTFTLDNGSNINVDTGVTLNALYKWAWNASTSMPTVSTSVTPTDQETVSPWERGVYAYTGAEDPPAPTITDTTNGTPPCPYGQDPINVTFSFTTDVNAYGRISTTNQTWDQMTSSKDMDTGEGTTTHSHVVSLACGQTISYYVAASTEVGDNGAESATTGIEVVIEAEQGINPPLAVTNLGSGSLGITNLGSGSLTVTIH